MQLIPYVYAFEFSFFLSNCNCESNVKVILSTTGTHEGDPLGYALFVLTHLKVLCFIINRFLSCLFPSIIDDNHIINPLSIVSFIYEHSQTNFFTIKNVQHCHPLPCHLILTPHLSLPPH